MSILNIWERLINKHSIPNQNSSDNTSISDVLGNKTDNVDGDSLFALSQVSFEDRHACSQCYPELQDGIQVDTAAGAWTLGNFTEIIPSNAITSKFTLQYISIEAVSGNDTYELKLYKGTLGNEEGICCFRFTENVTAGTGTIAFSVNSQILDANERISAKLASANGNEDATISLEYNIYT